LRTGLISTGSKAESYLHGQASENPIPAYFRPQAIVILLLGRTATIPPRWSRYDWALGLALH
jgi:hypothetical protein